MRVVKPGFGVETTTTTLEADERTVIVPPVDEIVMVMLVGGGDAVPGGVFAVATGTVVVATVVVATVGRGVEPAAVVGGIVAVATTVDVDGKPTSVISGTPNRLPLGARGPPVVAAAAGVANAASRRAASRMVPTPLATSTVAAQVAASQDATMVSRRLTPQCDRQRPRCVVTDP